VYKISWCKFPVCTPAVYNKRANIFNDFISIHWINFNWKYINITGDDFANMVQLLRSTLDQVLSFWQCLPIATPEWKLECITEQGWVTSNSCLLLLHNIPPEKSSLHASKIYQICNNLPALAIYSYIHFFTQEFLLHKFKSEFYISTQFTKCNKYYFRFKLKHASIQINSGDIKQDWI